MRSFSVDQWCEMHDLSRSFFYKLAAKGKAPRTFDVGAARRISEQANAEWIAAREAAPREDATRKEVAHKGVAARRAKAARESKAA